MTVRLNPYLSFRSSAREAMEFYRSVLGGTLELTTFGEAGITDYPGEEGKVMHSMLTTDLGLILMGADTPEVMEQTAGTNFAVSLSGDDDPTLRGYWTALAEDATDVMGLDTAPWGDSFGMLTDKFGIPWMVNIGAS
ncbi:VOC family protein [Rhodococcus triatomae]|uniref:PhnB protein n=1 Tax=Rhodococcus triatomae TaxID=300028 RepID=A0A1G8AXC8_9NOCA|nr:VOC family protein [Rhodococcus triatomae]QNG17645.1 VOC family protein [Rhodococcus triatomae]QNG22688.1 VOC family protein [Rhodococcus triatomae]SDH25639.1 PhnB protein [Rhodococcus triatomae]